MRIDAFIIWPHGVRYLSEIMVVLRDKFEIIMIYRKVVADMATFVDVVYGCDTYPLRHIKSKIRYLKKFNGKQEVFFVLVRNHNVNERMAGSGRFRKPQCMYLQGVKTEIRERFNPSKDNHIIHGTDYEKQVGYLLNVFGLKKKSYYTREIDFPVHYPYHLPKPKSWELKTKKIEDLRVGVVGKGLIKIEDSPHFSYLCGHKNLYNNYYYKYIGRQLKEDHFPEKFDQLIRSNPEDPIIVNGLRVLDGVHRLAIWMFASRENVNVIDVCL